MFKTPKLPVDFLKALLKSQGSDQLLLLLVDGEVTG